MGSIQERRAYSENLIASLRSGLSRAEALSADRACIFASGSLGRLEAGEFSDVDPCIVALCDKKKSKLSLLTEIRIKADLISVVEELGLKNIDGDGKYLGQFTSLSLIDEIGSPVDDSSNTFSTRLLMVLESKPIVQDGVYEIVLKKIIDAYWVDFDRYRDKFIPAYFTNDIIRLWRTFCINYEARTRKLVGTHRVKKKVKNYKLKHSRILTCYSAIIFLLWIFGKNSTVDPENAYQMAKMTPLERLSFVKDSESDSGIKSSMKNLIDMYELFLQSVNRDEKELEQEILDNKGYTREDYRFGQEMFNAVNLVGKGNNFHRLIVV